ncbi:MAG: ABC transporter permease [Chthonomonadaceae bacterium]|nr:ABC transporter permease [Chthonomonadaceae bacterium]
MKVGNLRAVVFFALLIACWATISKLGVWDSTLFPSPFQVVKTFWNGIADRSLLIATGASLRRLLLGYVISLVIGVPLGVLLARQKWADETIGLLVLGLQTLPSVCWLPLALLWFGLSDTAILFVVIMGAWLTITTAIRDGVRNVPPVYLRAARTMGTKPLSLYLEVLLPAALPSLLTGAKLGWSFAWRSLMAGELLFVSIGLGHQMTMGRELGDMSQVITVMGVIIALGLLTDRLIFAPFEDQIRERWGLTAK